MSTKKSFTSLLVLPPLEASGMTDSSPLLCDVMRHKTPVYLTKALQTGRAMNQQIR